MSKALALLCVGPRDIPWGFDEIIVQKNVFKVIDKIMAEEDIRHFITSSVSEDDAFCPYMAILMKEKYPSVSIEIVIPYEARIREWQTHRQPVYKNALNICDTRHIISSDKTDSCNWLRDKYIADKADIIIAIWNWYKEEPLIQKYAKSLNKSLYRVDGQIMYPV